VPENKREEAHVVFQQAKSAYDILSDPNQRTIYDERGLEGIEGGPGGGPGFYTEEDMVDLFSQMFNGFGGEGMHEMGGRSKRTRDAHKTYQVTLEDLYNGKHVKMMLTRKVVCTTCKG